MAKQASPAQRVGDNGYYYFTYDYGAQYEIKTSAGVAVYEILDCIYRDGVESYTVRVTSGGIAKEREITLQRLRYVFGTAQSVQVVHAGEVQELPVTKEEVELYYTRIVKARNKRKREANAILKEDKEYQKLLAEEKELAPKWAQAICNESADECELAEKMSKISAGKRAILQKLNVEASELKTFEACEVCKDKGVTERGEICACACAQSDKIKAYCAAERLVNMRIEEQLNERKNA